PGGGGGGDPLADFLAAVRRPLEYLASARSEAAARTRLPGRELAARGRTVRTRLDGIERERFDTLCEGLEALGDTWGPDRGEVARLCRDLAAQIASGAPAPVSEPAAAPTYQGSSGDVAAALTQLARPVQFAQEGGPRRAERVGEE